MNTNKMIFIVIFAMTIGLFGCKPPPEAIFDAILSGKVDDVKKSLDKGSNVNERTKGGLTPLHSTLYMRNREQAKAIAELLLTRGADVNAKNYTDQGTPLHSAVTAGYKEIVELLVYRGADVNAKNKDGWTPLHLAICFGHKDIVELLLANKADINAKDNNGLTPAQLADRCNQKEIAGFLRQHEAKQ